MKLTSTVLARVLLIVLVSYFAFNLLTSKTPWILIDSANLGIHEIGHFIFGSFGEFVGILGGSLNQILVPCLFLVYFCLKKDFFASSVVLFWVGDNIINVSVYMKDAIPMALPLLGGEGVIHDWNWLFTHMGSLSSSTFIGGCFFFLGASCVILSLLGMVIFTYLGAIHKHV